MKNTYIYDESRKKQIEKGFMRELSRDLKAAGFPLSRKAKNLIKASLRDAAMVGACEERSRILKLESMSSRLRELITEISVLEVLGYE